MIAEDEFIVEGAFVSAVEVFICLINTEDSLSQHARLVVRHDVGKMLKTYIFFKLEVAKSLVMAAEVQDVWQNDHTFAVIGNLSRIYERRCHTYDDLAIFFRARLGASV